MLVNADTGRAVERDYTVRYTGHQWPTASRADALKKKTKKNQGNKMQIRDYCSSLSFEILYYYFSIFPMGTSSRTAQTAPLPPKCR